MRGPRISALCVALLLAACADGESSVETAGSSTKSASISVRSSTTAGITSTTTTTPPATTTTVAAAAEPLPAPPPPAPAPPPPTPAPPSNPNISPVTAEELYASWRPGCPVHFRDLRRITVSYLGFDGADHVGSLIVHADWAEALLGVFAQIHAAGFQIAAMEPVDAYGGGDNESMAANNTSAFNCRAVTGGTSWSRHSYGRAIDINPVQNPYVTSSGTILPPSGADYADDRSPRQGVITGGDAVVAAFASIGWQWGGHWNSPKDYQHFERR